MKKSRIIVVVLVAALVAAYFAFDLGRFLSIDYFKGQQSAIEAFFHDHPLQSAAIYFAVYVAVTGTIPAWGGHPHARGRSDLRAAVGSGDRLLRLHPWRHARLPRLAFPVARLGAVEVRRQAEAHQRGHREGRRLLPLRAAAGARVPVLRDQPRDGAHAHPRGDLLLGEPGGHARRDRGLRLRRHAARADHLAQGHPLAGASRRVRAAGHLSLRRQARPCRP